MAALAAFDASGQWAIDGATSVGAWIAKETLCDAGQGHRDARLARRLRDMPETNAALAAGDISTDHAHTIAAGKHVEGFAGAERVLVEQARGLRPSETRAAVTFWREVMGDERLPKAHDRQELFLSPRLDELWDVRGTLVGEGGAIADRALRHYMDHEAVVADGSSRTTRQRRADAFVGIFDRYLRGQLGTAASRPHINVICSLETLQGQSNEPGRTSSGEVLSADVCRRLAQDATISRVITDPTGLPLDVGRAHRTVTHAIRTALAIRDGGCSVPGCDMPPDWCDACHIGPGWIGGVPTSLATTALGCRRHHMMEQRGQIHLNMRDERPVWTRADGTEIKAWARSEDQGGRAPPVAA